MLSIRTIPLLASLVLFATSPAPAASPGYVRFCSGAQSETEAQLNTINAEQRKRFPVAQSDSVIVATALRAMRASNIDSLNGLTTASLAVRFYGVVTGR